ncbi:MAG: hypothetical protein II507_07285 [Treponema sp.]|nr:hypothetical protein [Treponema sp.]
MANLLISTSGHDYPERKETFYPTENRIYLAKLIEDFVGFPVVVEFRHNEWIRPSVSETLATRLKEMNNGAGYEQKSAFKAQFYYLVRLKNIRAAKISSDEIKIIDSGNLATSPYSPKIVKLNN